MPVCCLPLLALLLTTGFSRAGSTTAFPVGQAVNTTSGVVKGHPARHATDVSEYLGIPFAKPPVHDLRFAPPERYSGNSLINADEFSVSCPSAPQSIPNLPENNTLNGVTFAKNGIESLKEQAQEGDAFGEDCLTVNVWTKPSPGEKKAVMVWIYGGSFSTGSSSIRGTQGTFLADHHDVVLVSFNYRINIFGFPGNPSGPNNLGLLDQRMALEWVRDNIEAFGGDAARITLFGESAGSISVDYYSFAWTEDPIVAGLIEQSGNVFSFAQPVAQESAMSWYNVTGQMGCGGVKDDPKAVLHCMRSKKYSDILAALALTHLPGSGVTGLLTAFAPTVDEKVVFSDYASRAAAGSFIKRPIILGHNDYEAGFFKAVNALIPNAEALGILPPDFYWAAFDNLTFGCSTAHRAFSYHAAHVPTWRYRYFGNFPNLQLTSSPDSGAYHGSELPLVFGTTGGVGNSTAAEKAIGQEIREAWTDFAKDPHGTFPRKRPWPRYNPKKQTLLRIAYDNQTDADTTFAAAYDYICPFYYAISGSNSSGPRHLSEPYFPAFRALTKLSHDDAEGFLRLYKI